MLRIWVWSQTIERGVSLFWDPVSCHEASRRYQRLVFDAHSSQLTAHTVHSKPDDPTITITAYLQRTAGSSSAFESKANISCAMPALSHQNQYLILTHADVDT